MLITSIDIDDNNDARLGHERGHGGGGEHEHDHAQHQEAVWLGFVGLVAMICFFVFEKVINLIGEMRDKHSDDRKLRIVREGHVLSDQAAAEAVGGMRSDARLSRYCAGLQEQVQQLLRQRAGPGAGRHDAEQHRHHHRGQRGH